MFKFGVWILNNIAKCIDPLSLQLNKISAALWETTKLAENALEVSMML